MLRLSFVVSKIDWIECWRMVTTLPVVELSPSALKFVSQRMCIVRLGWLTNSFQSVDRTSPEMGSWS